MDKKDIPFNNQQQKKIDKQQPELMKRIGFRIFWRNSQSCREFAVDGDRDGPPAGEGGIMKDRMEKAKKEGRWQQLFTQAYRDIILEEHTHNDMSR